MLALSAVLGVLVGAGFAGFERVMHHGIEWLWHTVPGGEPSDVATILIATGGGVALGIAIWLVPGHGGNHPADAHGNLLVAGEPTLAAVAGSIVVGLVSLIGGAALGPEGALLPAVAGGSVLFARATRVNGPAVQLLTAAGLGALLAAMIGNPLAGVIPLMEVVPAGVAGSMTALVLPGLTASSTAVLTMQVLDVESKGKLPFVYDPFVARHLVWAVLVALIAGLAGLAVKRVTDLLRRVSVRTDRVHVVVTTTLGGLLVGVLYAIGGEHVRFAGIPELVGLVGTTSSVGDALTAVVVKIALIGVCIAAGYRGGVIFPIAFVGGAVGLTLHLLVNEIPMTVAVAVGLAAAMGAAMPTPATAALIAVSILTVDILPLALLGVVVAHALRLTLDRVVPSSGEPHPSPR